MMNHWKSQGYDFDIEKNQKKNPKFLKFSSSSFEDNDKFQIRV